jgi:hypothetical protein
VNTVSNLWVPQMLGSFWVAAYLAAVQEGLSSVSKQVRKEVSTVNLEDCRQDSFVGGSAPRKGTT